MTDDPEPVAPARPGDGFGPAEPPAATLRDPAGAGDAITGAAAGAARPGSWRCSRGGWRRARSPRDAGPIGRATAVDGEPGEGDLDRAEAPAGAEVRAALGRPPRVRDGGEAASPRDPVSGADHAREVPIRAPRVAAPVPANDRVGPMRRSEADLAGPRDPAARDHGRDGRRHRRLPPPRGVARAGADLLRRDRVAPHAERAAIERRRGPAPDGRIA